MPNKSFNADANIGHGFAIFMANVGALRPYGLRRRLTRALDLRDRLSHAQVNSPLTGKEMAEYQRPEDLTYAKDLMRLAPKEAQAFLGLKAASERTDGVIPEKYRELMSIAVALTTQCSYCIDAHTKNAVKAGASREEIAETVFIASALRAGAAVGHGLLALRLFDEASKPKD